MPRWKFCLHKLEGTAILVLRVGEPVIILTRDEYNRLSDRANFAQAARLEPRYPHVKKEPV